MVASNEYRTCSSCKKYQRSPHLKRDSKVEKTQPRDTKKVGNDYLTEKEVQEKTELSGKTN